MEKVHIDDLFADPRFKWGSLSGRDVGAVQGHLPAVTFWPSGRLLFNVASSRALWRVATAADLDYKECGIRFAVDEAKLLVAIYPVRLGTTSSDPLRLTKGSELAMLHLKGILAEFPQFRSSQTLVCPVFGHKDADGKHCLVVAVQNGVPKVKRTRPVKEAGGDKKETKGETKGTTKETAQETDTKETPATEVDQVVAEVAPATTSTTPTK